MIQVVLTQVYFIATHGLHTVTSLHVHKFLGRFYD
jgi:hypothetical protein